jgi:hypothetical protein
LVAEPLLLLYSPWCARGSGPEDAEGNARLNDDCDCTGVAVDRLVVDADAVADVVTGAIGPLISKSSTSKTPPRFADAGVEDVVEEGCAPGLDRCCLDDDAAGAADTRADLADWGVVVVCVGADFLICVGRAFGRWACCDGGGSDGVGAF